MKERGTLFNTEMVKAILDGRKTHTRRLTGLEKINKAPDLWEHTISEVRNGFLYFLFWQRITGEGFWIKSFYGQPGNRLWVRENMRLTPESIDYVARPTQTGLAPPITYCPEFTEEQLEWFYGYGNQDRENITVPSIHMPRWASRINLEITNIRVERIKDITITDIVAEGVDGNIPYTGGPSYYHQNFRRLWNSINAKRGYGWDINCWVWVIEFKGV